MVKITMREHESISPSEFTIVQCSRVPFVGEFIQENVNTPVRRVLRVVHHLDINKGTVANITVTAD